MKPSTRWFASLFLVALAGACAEPEAEERAWMQAAEGEKNVERLAAPGVSPMGFLEPMASRKDLTAPAGEAYPMAEGEWDLLHEGEKGEMLMHPGSRLEGAAMSLFEASFGKNPEALTTER